MDDKYYDVSSGIPNSCDNLSPHIIKHCIDCYHRLDNGFCACREIVDMILTDCPDWYPRGL